MICLYLIFGVAMPLLIILKCIKNTEKAQISDCFFIFVSLQLQVYSTKLFTPYGRHLNNKIIFLFTGIIFAIQIIINTELMNSFLKNQTAPLKPNLYDLHTSRLSRENNNKVFSGGTLAKYCPTDKYFFDI